MIVSIEPKKCYKCRTAIYPLERLRLGFPLRDVTCGDDPIGWACDGCDLQPQQVPVEIESTCRAMWESSVSLSLSSIIENLTR